MTPRRALITMVLGVAGAAAPVYAQQSSSALAPERSESTAVESLMRPHRFGNGFYAGIGGGKSMPTGSVRNVYNPGVNVSVPFGWDAPLGPVGFQGLISYNTFDARSTFREGRATSGATALTNVNPQIWSALADAKLRLPFQGTFLRGATTGLYAIGGVGLHWMRNYATTFGVTSPTTNINARGIPNADVSKGGSLIRFGMNGGGGLSLGLGAAELFVESRYTRIFTAEQRLDFVPVVAGITLR